MVGWLIGWLVGWLVSWLVDWLVGWLVGWWLNHIVIHSQCSSGSIDRPGEMVTVVGARGECGTQMMVEEEIAIFFCQGGATN